MTTDVYVEARRLAVAHGVEFAADWFELAHKHLMQLPKGGTEAQRKDVMRFASCAVAHRLEPR